MRARTVFAILAACALGIAWIGSTSIDLRLAQAVYDPASASFPWRHTWFAETFCHTWLKTLLVTLGTGVVLTVALDLVRPRPAWRRRYRQRLRMVALSALLVPLAIGALKQASASHCPWDLSMFGGSARYVRLFEPVPARTVAGRCMPAGHASSGLWLAAFAVFWLPGRPRRAGAVGAGLMTFGFALGWVQQLRGAHFLTHTLWSMWWAALLMTMLYVALLRPRRRRDPYTPHSTSCPPALAALSISSKG